MGNGGKSGPRARRACEAGLLLFLVGALAACAAPSPAPGAGTGETRLHPSFTQEGLASWYGRGHDGHLTASGERFDMHQMTAAHRSLPFGTMLRVTNLENGRAAEVRVNDRGPYRRDRIIDLSAAAAAALGITNDGVARVRIEAIGPSQS